MANFNTHFAVAAGAGGVLSGAFLSLGLFQPGAALTGFGLTLLGGLLPDVDSDNSKPLQIGFGVIALLAAFFVTFEKGAGYSVAEMGLIWLATYALVRYGVMGVFQRLTRHRGLFHSVPAALLAGLLCVCLMTYIFQVNAQGAWIFGGLLCAGYLIHLLLDELVSVNLLGQRVKQSFGTAFKLYQSSRPLLSAFLYLVILFVWWLTPSASSVFALAQGDSLLRQLAGTLVPQGSWFQGFF